MENSDLKYIKKHYGENFAHLCRSLFPQLLERAGVLQEAVTALFVPSRNLFDDITQNEKENDFKSYILSFTQKHLAPQKKVKIDKTPEQLMDEAGYILFPECQTEDDVQSFKKYWEEDEQLCTFYNRGRLNRCRVWFAIKKDVAEIKRENFTQPRRQDEYGTSAISIQFTLGSPCTLSIKNRYNHTVADPDATFSNNLENIKAGLTDAFEETYGIKISEDFKNNFELPHYTKTPDGKFVYYTHEIDAHYYCASNIVIKDGEVEQFDKSKYLLLENYLLDLSSKSIKNLVKTDPKPDAFIKSIGKIENVKMTSLSNGNKKVAITPTSGQDIEIEINNHNEFISYFNPNIETIEDKFLYLNESLKTFNAPNAEQFGDNFLYINESLTSFDAPNAKIFGNNFLGFNECLKTFNAPNAKIFGNDFLGFNKCLKTFNAPNAKIFGDNFLRFNNSLKTFNAPNAEQFGDNFLLHNENLDVTKIRHQTKLIR